MLMMITETNANKLLVAKKPPASKKANDQREPNSVINGSGYNKLVIATLLINFLVINEVLQVNALLGKFYATKDYSSAEYQRFVKSLRQQDSCGAVFTAKIHGYEIKEYTVRTKDNYVLKLHRLIHPSDGLDGPKIKAKKPYLLLHGLIGTSASYVLNTSPNYRAPPETMDINPQINEMLWHKANDFEFNWQSSADYLNTGNNGNDKRNSQKAYVDEIDFDADLIPFAKEFKQSHRKFNLPKASKDYVTNSLAFTLSNFNYDVWLLNLRGNSYSKKFDGRGSADDAEYWDFNIDTLIREDLLASINFVEKETQWPGPMGFVSYSYTNTHILGLLTNYPTYQDTLQPVVMLAPTLLTLTPERSKLRYVVKVATELFLSNNGPFPALGRVKEDRIERLICHLPLASKLCSLLEQIIHGKPKSLTSLVFDDRETSLIRQDTSCGQTSKAVLHQLIKNLAHEDIDPQFSPFTKARLRVMQGKPVRRSVMLFHSKGDDVATMADVNKIRDSSLRLLALSDYVINDKHFGHTDFLFSDKNHLVLNAEIVRQVRLFDFMIMFSTPDLQPFGKPSTTAKQTRKQRL